MARQRPALKLERVIFVDVPARDAHAPSETTSNMSKRKTVSAGPVYWPDVVATIAPMFDDCEDFYDDVPGQLAASKPPDYAGGWLSGCNIAAAARAVLRGPSSALPLLQLAMPGLPHVIDELPVLDKDASLPAYFTLCFVNIARCCGAPCPPQAAGVELAWLPQLAQRAAQLNEVERHTLALATCAAGLAGLAGTFTQVVGLPTGFTPGQTQGFDVPAFAGYIAAALQHGASYQDVEPAWLDFVHRFPYKLDTRMLGWPALLWAARAVYTAVGGLPEGEVAMELHRQVTGA